MKRLYWYRKLMALVGVLVVFLLISLPAVGVNAQELTELRIRPETTNATVGEDIVLTVDVLRGVNLSGYDLTISYDPAVLELVSWAHGSYLSSLAMMKTDLQPGRIRLAAVQVGKPGVSGDGTLLVLTFRAAHAGFSNVGIAAVDLATDEGTRVIPATSDAVITVNPPHTETLPPTATPTLTLTATRTLTRTATKTATTTLTRTFVATATHTPTLAGSLASSTATPFPPILLQTGTAEGSATQYESRTPRPDGSPASETSSAVAIAGTITPTSLSTAAGTDASEARLNRLLWGFALFLVLILAGMVLILMRHKKSLNGKG
jgi:hypothetical protein